MGFFAGRLAAVLILSELFTAFLSNNLVREIKI